MICEKAIGKELLLCSLGAAGNGQHAHVQRRGALIRRGSGHAFWHHALHQKEAGLGRCGSPALGQDGSGVFVIPIVNHAFKTIRSAPTGTD